MVKSMYIFSVSFDTCCNCTATIVHIRLLVHEYGPRLQDPALSYSDIEAYDVPVSINVS